MMTTCPTVTQLSRSSGYPLFRSDVALQAGDIVRTEKRPCPVMKTPRFDCWRILCADGDGLYRGEACSEPRQAAPAHVMASVPPVPAPKRLRRKCTDCGGHDDLCCECVS